MLSLVGFMYYLTPRMAFGFGIPSLILGGGLVPTPTPMLLTIMAMNPDGYFYSLTQMPFMFLILIHRDGVLDPNEITYALFSLNNILALFNF